MATCSQAEMVLVCSTSLQAGMVQLWPHMVTVHVCSQVHKLGCCMYVHKLQVHKLGWCTYDPRVHSWDVACMFTSSQLGWCMYIHKLMAQVCSQVHKLGQLAAMASPSLFLSLRQAMEASNQESNHPLTSLVGCHERHTLALFGSTEEQYCVNIQNSVCCNAGNITHQRLSN